MQYIKAMHCSLNLNIQQIFDLINFFHVHLFIVNLYLFPLNTTWDIISVNCQFEVKPIMTLLIKVSTLDLKVSINIIIAILFIFPLMFKTNIFHIT